MLLFPHVTTPVLEREGAVEARVLAANAPLIPAFAVATDANMTPAMAIVRDVVG